MAKTGAIPPEQTLKPDFALRVCIGCGLGAHWKFDRRGRPFHYCSDCGLRIFIYTWRALTGLQIAHDLVIRSGVQRFRMAVHTRTSRKLAASAR